MPSPINGPFDSIGGVQILNSDLVIFIDETGDEGLPPGTDWFGLGGVIVCGSDYADLIVNPWNELRHQMQVRRGVPLHASTDFPIYKPHLEKLDSFFRNHAFIRHASMITKATTSDIEAFRASACGGMFVNMGRSLIGVISRTWITRLVFVVEHSKRLKPKFDLLVGPRGPNLCRADGLRISFEHTWVHIPKSKCEPGLEVADFVVHTAQGHVRAKMAGKTTPQRLDFESVFRSVSPELAQYMEINDLSTTPADGPDGLFRVGL